MNWLDIAVEMQAIAQAGLTYGKDIYDKERYQQLRELSAEVMAAYTQLPPLSTEKTTAEQIALCFAAQADEDWQVVYD